jgi:hypothetical protein
VILAVSLPATDSDSPVEAIVSEAVNDSATSTRTQAINQFKAVMVVADPVDTGTTLPWPCRMAAIRRCATLQPRDASIALLCGRSSHLAASPARPVMPRTGQVVVGMTHSPLLRAIAGRMLGADPGEPEHLHGYSVRVDGCGALHVEAYRPFEEVEGSSI